jgi:hypothetical protein
METTNLIYAYTASDAERDGLLLRFSPATTLEAGYALPVLITQKAYEEAVQWTRGGAWQSEDARWWDVLMVARRAGAAALKTGRAQPTRVLRVPNLTAAGKPSRAERPSGVSLEVRAEGFDLTGSPCIIISIPGED